MLRTADSAVLDSGPAWPNFDSGRDRALTGPSVAAIRDESGAAWQPSSYRASRGSSPVAMAGSLLAVAGLISAFMWMNVSPGAKARHELVMVDLAVTPPPPPPRQQPAPKERESRQQPNQPQIVTPPPIVSVAAPSTVVTTAQPNPPPVVVAAPVAPAVAAPPAPLPAIASAGDLSSTMISAKPPAYPLDARRKHEQGTVVLKLVLGTDGQVSEIAVSQSSGSDRLDQAALSAVRKWRWKPVMRNGEAIMVQGMVTIPFVLKP